MPMMNDPRLGLALVRAGKEEESEGAPFSNDSIRAEAISHALSIT
jgi:hypothetical protein